MKKILAMLLVMFVAYSVVAQQTGPSKKCNTCGLSIAKCKYHGKHPKQTPSKPTKPAEPVKPTKPTKPTVPSKPSKPVEPAKPSNPAVTDKPTSGSVNGHEWVDLGLSVKWATCNVGADSPSDYGNYYAWGETRPKSRYVWSNCFDCLDDSGDIWDVYKLEGKTRITPTSGHDTARENWGGTWRMPTISELEELDKKCKWTWTTKNGHNGYVVTGPNGKSIFLPAAGWRYGSDTYNVGSGGYYWSSMLSSSNSNNARGLYFNGSGHDTYDDDRRNGRSVRPVTE